MIIPVLQPPCHCPLLPGHCVSVWRCCQSGGAADRSTHQGVCPTPLPTQSAQCLPESTPPRLRDHTLPPADPGRTVVW